MTLIVVGLASEARLFGRDNPRVLVGGGRAAERLDGLASATGLNITGVLSFGLAGGLRSGLRPGTLIVAERICDGDDVHESDPDWRAELVATLGGAILGDLAGVDAPVAETAAKAELWEKTGAAAVDMESHAAARFARERGLRFAAVRAVADPAERGLPPAARFAMRPDGGIDLPSVARSVISRPTQIGELVRLGRDAAAAMRALEIAARALALAMSG